MTDHAMAHPLTDDDVLRDCISEFSDQLRQMLVANQRGVAWRESRQTWLVMRLRQEVEELADAIGYGTTSDLRKECLDVAAFAMMVWDRSQR